MSKKIKHSTQILNFEGEEISLADLHQHFIDSNIENYVGIRTDIKGYVHVIFSETEIANEKINSIHNINKDYVDVVKAARGNKPLLDYDKFAPPRVTEFLDKR